MSPSGSRQWMRREGGGASTERRRLRMGALPSSPKRVCRRGWRGVFCEHTHEAREISHGFPTFQQVGVADLQVSCVAPEMGAQPVVQCREPRTERDAPGCESGAENRDVRHQFHKTEPSAERPFEQRD